MVAEMQPSFEAIERDLASVAEQFGRCRNLPAVDQGAQVLAALQQIHEGLGGVRDELRELNARMGRQEVRTRVS